MQTEQIARVCHEVNRAYCKALGDESQLPWVDAPAMAKGFCNHGRRIYPFQSRCQAECITRVLAEAEGSGRLGVWCGQKRG